MNRQSFKREACGIVLEVAIKMFAGIGALWGASFFVRFTIKHWYAIGNGELACLLLAAVFFVFFSFAFFLWIGESINEYILIKGHYNFYNK